MTHFQSFRGEPPRRGIAMGLEEDLTSFFLLQLWHLDFPVEGQI